jgi:hypothetical protein
MTLRRSILIGAIGLKDTGKSTVLSFLAENFYDNDVLCKAHFCDKSKDFLHYFDRKAELSIVGSRSFSYPVMTQPEYDVVLVDNLTEDTAHKLKALDGILIRVDRNVYSSDIGRQSVNHRLPTENEKWTATIRTDLHITSFEESLRRLKFETTLLYDTIINHTKFKNCCE